MPEIPKAELEEMSERANLIKQTITTRGWMDIIRPALVGRKESLIKTMLSKKYDNLSEITYVQQSINAIDAILTLIESTIVKGEDADKRLQEAVLAKQNEY